MKTAAITITEYQGFQRAYDFFNRELFGGSLPVSGHRGTEEAYLANTGSEADYANVAVRASVLLSHQLSGSPHRPRGGAMGAW
jgi:hypothetical protein